MKKIINLIFNHVAIFSILSLFDHDNSNIVSKKGLQILSDKIKLEKIEIEQKEKEMLMNEYFRQMFVGKRFNIFPFYTAFKLHFNRDMNSIVYKEDKDFGHYKYFDLYSFIEFKKLDENTKDKLKKSVKDTFKLFNVNISE